MCQWAWGRSKGNSGVHKVLERTVGDVTNQIGQLSFPWHLPHSPNYTIPWENVSFFHLKRTKTRIRYGIGEEQDQYPIFCFPFCRQYQLLPLVIIFKFKAKLVISNNAVPHNDQCSNVEYLFEQRLFFRIWRKKHIGITSSHKILGALTRLTR